MRDASIGRGEIDEERRGEERSSRSEFGEVASSFRLLTAFLSYSLTDTGTSQARGTGSVSRGMSSRRRSGSRPADDDDAGIYAALEKAQGELDQDWQSFFQKFHLLSERMVEVGKAYREPSIPTCRAKFRAFRTLLDDLQANSEIMQVKSESFDRALLRVDEHEEEQQSEHEEDDRKPAAKHGSEELSETESEISKAKADDETQAKLEQSTSNLPKRKRQKVSNRLPDQAGPNDTFESQTLVLKDRRYHEQSKQIHAKHSSGRPRPSLTELLVKANKGLGLFADFGQSMFSTKGGKISQLTLSIEWNDFVGSHSEPQKLYIGNGPIKEKMAEVIAKTREEIPIFFDPKEDTCVHYVGHFKVVPSTVKRYPGPDYFLFKGRPRCMFVELKFSRYDDGVCDAIRNGA